MLRSRRYRTGIRYSLTDPDIEPIRSEETVFLLRRARMRLGQWTLKDDNVEHKSSRSLRN